MNDNSRVLACVFVALPWEIAGFVAAKSNQIKSFLMSSFDVIFFLLCCGAVISDKVEQV